MINAETISKLISIYAEDTEFLDILHSSLKSFEEYHSAIYEMETWMRIYSYNSVDKEEYQSRVADMDKCRTACHNSVLISVNVFLDYHNLLKIQHSMLQKLYLNFLIQIMIHFLHLNNLKNLSISLSNIQMTKMNFLFCL